MFYVLAVSGAAILTIRFSDVLWTAMGIGGGASSRRLSMNSCRLLMRVYRVGGSRLFLSWIAIIVLITMMLAWVAVLWTGWTLIFIANETAVVNAQTSVPADFWERFYFTGFTVFALGVGDFRPEGAAYRLLTAFASLAGLFIVTFGVTCLVPIVQAATLKRRMGVTIAGLGLRGRNILLNTWSGSDFGVLSRHLLSLTSDFSLLEQQRLTYPALYYFHGRRRSESLALDEALTIPRYGLKEDLRPLRSRGLPTVSDAEFETHMDRLSERRRLLYALVRKEGWFWEVFESAQDRPSPEKPIDRDNVRIAGASEHEGGD